jgi:hypothetical protein
MPEIIICMNRLAQIHVYQINVLLPLYCIFRNVIPAWTANQR